MFNFFLIVLLVQNAVSLRFPAANVQLYCNRLYGNFYGQSIIFARALQSGDQLTINGTVLPVAATSVQFSFWASAGLDQIPFHMRQDLPKQNTIFNNFVGTTWKKEVYGPSIFALGQNYQVTVKFLGNQFQVWSNGGIFYTFTARSSVDNIQALDFMSYFVYDAMKTNWVEIECINPPWPKTTTRRPGGRPPGHGGGTVSSSSSSESCEK